jgi:hypothetical protein
MVERPYMVIQVTVSRRELSAQMPLAADRDTREAALKTYLETLGLRPRHGCGTLEMWDDPASGYRTYHQRIPRE